MKAMNVKEKFIFPKLRLFGTRCGEVLVVGEVSSSEPLQLQLIAGSS